MDRCDGAQTAEIASGAVRAGPYNVIVCKALLAAPPRLSAGSEGRGPTERWKAAEPQRVVLTRVVRQELPDGLDHDTVLRVAVVPDSAVEHHTDVLAGGHWQSSWALR